MLLFDRGLKQPKDMLCQAHDLGHIVGVDWKLSPRFHTPSVSLRSQQLEATSALPHIV